MVQVEYVAYGSWPTRASSMVFRARLKGLLKMSPQLPGLEPKAYFRPLSIGAQSNKLLSCLNERKRLASGRLWSLVASLGLVYKL